MLQWRTLFLLALLAPSFGSPLHLRNTHSKKAAIPPKYRLPKNIIPQSYVIELKPTYINKRILDIEEFTGRVEIVATVKEDTNKIVLHHGDNIDIPENGIKVFRIIPKSTTTDDPNTDDPNTDDPITDDPNTDDPNTDDPNTDDSNTDDSNTDDPNTDDSNTDDPNTDDSNKDDPITGGSSTIITSYVSEIYHETYSNENGRISIFDKFDTDRRIDNDEFDEWEELNILSRDDYNEETEILTIVLDGTLKMNSKIKIEITYTGVFVEHALTGFYYSSYMNENNDQAAVLATQFESTYARMAFPCFDEPWMKATFDLSIKTTSLVGAIANTKPKETSRSDDAETIVKFKQSPIMSTYLLAFVVYEKDSFGDLGSTSKSATWGRKETSGLAALSIDDVEHMLDTLKRFTGIDYFGPTTGNTGMGMEKMDQAAIPEFKTGAMENWGLMTYKENALLFDDTNSVAAQKRVSEVIAHECAHLWFGDLVTTKWWDSTWLNEGFANFYQYYVTGEKYPEWDLLTRFVLDEQMVAFDADSVASAEALTSDVYSPSEINSHFGSITYSKGGCIVRQIRNVLGPDAFEEAVKDYLQKNAFSAAVPEDLFESLLLKNNEAITMKSKDNLKKVLINWTKTPGYPVITVEKSGTKDIHFKQDRYLLPGNENAETPTYDVYLTWFTDKSEQPTEAMPPQIWLEQSDTSVTIETEEDLEEWEWIIVNPYQAGYYRVDYSSSLWSKLSDALQSSATREKISALDRAALINNALNLARSAENRNIDYGGAFRLMKFLREDFSFEPWAATRSSLAHIERLLVDSSEYKDFIKYIVEGAYEAIEFKDPTTEERNKERTNRVNILTLACAAGYSPCLEEAQKRLSEYLDPESKVAIEVPADLQTVVYCYGLKGENGARLWEKLWDKYVDLRKDMARRVVIATALGCVNDKDTLRNYLDLSLNMNGEDNVPYHEANAVFTSVYSNPEVGPGVALAFLEEKGLDLLTRSYGEDYIANIITGLGGRLTTQNQKQKLKEILGDNYPGAISAAEANLKWLDTYEKPVKEGMKNVNGAPTVFMTSTLAALCVSMLTAFR